MKSSELAKNLARKLRKNQTDVEKLLWEKLLPENLPFSSDFDIDKLISYSLTGGQIELIIKNTAYKLAIEDEPVFNIPGLGKSYLRALQHRDLISVMPDGTRIYEFHPWEKNIRRQKSYVGEDVPILDYLKRLEDMGEDVKQYETIWYYY